MYAYGLIPRDIRDSLIDVETKVPDIKILTKAELKLLLQEASKHPGYYFEILLALFAGLRGGEVESSRVLRVADFLFEELGKKRAFNQKIIDNRKAQGKKDGTLLTALKRTCKEFFDYWLYHHMIVEKEIAYNTFQSYRNILYNHLMPELKGETKLIRVRIEDLVKAVEKIEFSTVKDAAAKLIVEIFTFARDQHYISFNPALAACQQLKKQLTKKKKRNVIPYTISEIKRLLYICKQDFPDMYLPLLLSLTLGSRISETLGLRYSDVDFSAETIYIRIQLGRSIEDNSEESLLTKPIKTVYGAYRRQDG